MASRSSLSEFRYEKEMTHAAREWLFSQGLVVKEEFQTTCGICDLVGCSLREESVQQRLSYGQKQPIGTYSRIFILQLLPDSAESDRGMTIPHITRLCGPYTDTDKVEREMEKLVKTKHAIRTSTGSYQKVNGWAPLHKRLVAVELKLSRVGEALWQAATNKTFASESYVGMPISVAEAILNGPFLSRFTDEGIGLLGIEDGSCRVVIEASPSYGGTNPVMQMHVVERFWRNRAVIGS